MKNFFICLISLCAKCTFLCGCGSKKDAQISNADSLMQTEEDNLTSQLPQVDSAVGNIEQDTQNINDKISITRYTYSEGKISLNFPVISGFENEQLENECNNILKNSLLERKQHHSARDVLTADFEITASTDEFLSILTTIQIIPDGAATPYYLFQSLNVDLANGKIVRLCDNYSANQLAIDFSAQWVLSTPNGRTADAAEALTTLSHKELAAKFSKCDVKPGEIYAEGCSFVRDDQTYVYIPINHALGDYALCKIY